MSPFLALIQSRAGYIWAATQTGIVRFDGSHFTTLRTDNTPGLRRSYGLALLDGSDGGLWVGTYGGGLSRIENSQATTYTIKNGLMQDAVFSLCEDQEGGIWLGFSSGVQRFFHGKFETYTRERLGARGTVHAITADRRGGIWLFAGQTMISINAGHITRYPMNAWAPQIGAQAILVDHSGKVLVATQAGLYQLAEGHFKRYGPMRLAKETINCILEDQEHGLWLGTPSGLRRWVNGTLQSFNVDDGLSGNFVLALLCDKNGDIWVDTLRGLDQFKDGLSRTFSRKHGVASDFVWSAVDDSHGRSWIATDAGLTRLNGSLARTFTTKDGLKANNVFCVTVDHNDTVWVGGTGWVGSLKHGELPINILSTQPPLGILAPFETSAGDLLFGSTSGLLQLAGGKLTLLPFELSPVHSLFEAPRGHLWISTIGQLIDLASGRFERYGGTNDAYNYSLVDAEGTVWAMSQFDGLARIKNGVFRRLSPAADQLRPPLYAAVEDNKGNLWITSPRGLLRVSKRELNDYADGFARSAFVAVFDMEDGLPTTDFSAGVQNAVWKRRDGTFWLPTTNGLVLFNPAAVKPASALPTYVEAIRVDEKPVSMNEPLVLSPRHKRIEFDFTAIEFHNSAQVFLRYRMDGFDSQWMPAGSKRTAIYTGLRHGSYVFRVSARNRDGLWSEAKSFAFKVDPFFYETLGFYILCLLAGSSLLLAAYKLRMSRIKARLTHIHEQRMAERSRIAVEVHDTLLQGVAGAAMMLQSVKKNVENSETKDGIERVLHEMHQSMANTRRTLFEIESPETTGGLASLEGYARALTTALNLKLTYTASPGPLVIMPELETDLLRVGKEAVLNAAKHSQGTEIKVSLEFTDELSLTVEDDGTGFPLVASPSAGHWGIPAMRERLGRWGGCLELSNRTGGGTILSAKVPRPPL